MSAWSPGKVIAGKYTLVDRVGQGGMGAVWRARHLELDALVALKELDGRLANTPIGRARFLREAKAAAALRSPHVIQIHDYGLDDDTPFIAMELLEGESLAARLRRGPLGFEATWRVIDQVLRAIGRAHQVGIVHRDLKPPNIFVTPNEAEESPLLRETWLVKVLDFGIAKQVDASAPDPPERDDAGASLDDEADATPSPQIEASTETGAAIGTPQYMSPEQTRGKAVDARSDLWAVGVITYECLVGKPVFERGPFGSLVLQICTDPLPVPSAKADVPAGFDAWFEKALARAPDDRFQTAAEMSDALRKVLTPATPAEPPTASQRIGEHGATERSSRRASRTLAIAATVAVAGGALWWATRTPTAQEGEPTVSSATAAESASPSFEPRSTPAPKPRRLSFLGLPSRAVISPAGDFVVFGTLDGERWTVWRQRLDGEPVELFRIHDVDALAVSPKGDAIIAGAASEDGPRKHITITVDGAVSEREAKTFFEASWSPDGKEVATVEGSTRKDVTLLSASGESRQLAIEGDYQWLVDVAWTPRSDAVLAMVTTAAGDQRLIRVPKGGGPSKAILEGERRFTDAVTSEDALFMLRPNRGASELVRFAWPPGEDAPTNTPEVLLSGLQVTGLSVSRDGKKLAYTKREAASNVWLVDTARGMASKREVTRGAREHRAPTFSPDGNALAMIRRANDSELIVMPVEGGAEQRLSAPDHLVGSLAWAPDGTSLAYTTTVDPHLYVAELAGGAPRVLPTSEPPSTSIDALGWAPGPTLWFQASGNRNFFALDGGKQREAPLLDAPEGWSFYPTQNEAGDVALFRNVGKKDDPFGVWIVGADGKPPAKITNGRYFPIRYTGNGKGVYALQMGGAGDEPVAIVRVPVSGGAVEPMLTFDAAPNVVVGADVTADGKRAAVSIEKREFDVWVAEIP